MVGEQGSKREDKGRLPGASPEGKARLGEDGKTRVSPLSCACQRQKDTQKGVGCQCGSRPPSLHAVLHRKWVSGKEMWLKFNGEGEGTEH